MFNPSERAAEIVGGRHNGIVSKEQLTRIFEQKRTTYYGFARRFCHTKEEAEDLLAEAMLRMLSTNTVVREAKLESWIRRVIHNTLIDLIRKRKRRAEVFLNEAKTNEAKTDEESANGELGLELGENDPNFQLLMDRLGQTDLMIAVEMCLPKMSAVNRQILEVYITDPSLPCREIANILGLRRGTVHNRLQRSRRELRKFLIHEPLVKDLWVPKNKMECPRPV